MRAVGLLARLRAQRAGAVYVVENLSRGGAFFRTAVPARVGTVLRFELVTPNRTVLSLEGRVVSAAVGAHAGMGIAFSSAAPDVEHELRRLLRSLATRPQDLEGDRSSAEPGSVILLPPPGDVPPNPPAPVASELDRLKVQVCGLLMQLGEAQTRVDVLERENAELRENARWQRAVRSVYCGE